MEHGPKRWGLLVAGVSLALSACSVAGSPGEGGGGVASAIAASEEGSEVVPAGSTVEGTPACQEQATRTWRSASYEIDPLAAVRSGEIPTVPDGIGDRPPDVVRDFPTLAVYDDPSTLEQPEVVAAAFERAGYLDGVDARWGYSEVNFAAVTMVRFRDAAAAQEAMTAHLTDLCRRAVHATVRPDGTGLTLLRDSGAVRSLFVVDDVEVSVFVCACFFADATERQDGIEAWSAALQEAVGATPAPESSAS